MGRVSQAQAQENRKRVVATAARMFRERGIQGVSVADVMAEVGLTHGGFYRQFASKEALVAEATALAFGDLAGLLSGLDGSNANDHGAALRELIDYYLSPAHRDDPGAGCPTTAFGRDMARGEGAEAARAGYADGVQQFARWLSTDGGEDYATLCTLVGALTLARATAGTDISDRVLAAARAGMKPG
jgi:TetR/AcrR family transcriptional repressor of nem operon